MDYVCDVPGGKTWFRIETEAEAIRESALMPGPLPRPFSVGTRRPDVKHGCGAGPREPPLRAGARRRTRASHPAAASPH
jgi:hypothetical protein